MRANLQKWDALNPTNAGIVLISALLHTTYGGSMILGVLSGNQAITTNSNCFMGVGA
jgi:hypothetical protein